MRQFWGMKSNLVAFGSSRGAQTMAIGSVKAETQRLAGYRTQIWPGYYLIKTSQ